MNVEKYVINGGASLRGEVEISGAKNAAVAIIPAALLVDGVCRIENIPQISDADMLLTILSHLGSKVRFINRTTIEIDSSSARCVDAPYDLTRKIRASYYLIGAMLGRFGRAKTTMPGGCNFGVRPIEQHIKGMTALGADVDVRGGFVIAETPDGCAKRLCDRRDARRLPARRAHLSRQGLRRRDDEHHPRRRDGPRPYDH